MENTADNAAMIAKIMSTAGRPEVSATIGAITIGRAKPHILGHSQDPLLQWPVQRAGTNLRELLLKMFKRKGLSRRDHKL